MNYHLNRNGQALGLFSLEELRRKRQSGELTGEELIWGKGMASWQLLDVFLASSRKSGPASKRIILTTVFVGVALLIAGVVAVGFIVRKVQTEFSNLQQQFSSTNRGLELAGTVHVHPNTLTASDLKDVGREFRLRHYLGGYKADGNRNSPCDDASILYLRAWIAQHFGGEKPTLALPFDEFGEELANNPECTDPLVLAIAGIHTTDPAERIRRLEQAVRKLEQSKYKSYPRFWVTVSLTAYLKNQPERFAALDSAALLFLRQAISDGSYPPEDQFQLAESLVHGWGKAFFKRQATEVSQLAAEAGPDFNWLALVLEGEYHVIRGWNARGGGFSHTISETGWKGFLEHMAAARHSFTEAWEIRPEHPLPASRMIYVAMGESKQEDMRLWFERALDAQIDYPEAWDRMRWGLRPRWHGSLEAMLALGISAVDTERFDTDVPRKIFDVIGDMQSELKVPAGEYLYGREDIWPHLKRMYEGYLAEPSRSEEMTGWRSAYAGVAYFAGKYDVARDQLELVDWEPWPGPLAWWNVDITLMPLEVAARTGSHGEKIARAEAAWNREQTARAVSLYTEIAATDPDDRTRRFVQHRLAALE